MVEAPRGAIWAANIFAFILDKSFQAVEFISDQFHEINSLEDCRSAEDLRKYAESIKHRQPAFANELFAMANNSEKID